MNGLGNFQTGGFLPGKTGARLGIRGRMLLVFCLVVVCGVALIELVGLLGLQRFGIKGDIPAAREHALQMMSDHADVRREILQQWLHQRREDVDTLAAIGKMSQSAAKLAPQLAAQLQRGEMTAQDKERFRQLPGYTELAQKLQSFGDFHADISNGFGFVDAASGRVIISSREQALGVDLSTNPFITKGRKPGNAKLADIFVCPMTGLTSLALTRQIFDQNDPGKLRAIAYFLVKLEAIPLKEEESYLGKHVETILINQDQRLISELRHALPNGKKAKRLEYQVESKLAQLVSGGGEGLIHGLDYRGVPVLAAFRYLPISADQGWGIIVKQDEAEVLAMIYERLWQRLPLALVSLLLMVLAIAWLAQRIAKPVTSLAQTARALQQGNLAARSSIVRDDEIGLLAHAFNAMADRIASWHESLSQTVTERTRQLVRANQLFQLLGQSNQAIVQCKNEFELFENICRNAVELGGMKMAWVGVIDANTERVRPVASFGDTLGYLQGIEISVRADHPAGQGPAGIALRENRVVWFQDLQNDPGFLPWRERTARSGLFGCAGLPLLRRGKAVAALLLYAGEANAFDAEVQKLLIEMARDISFALDHYAGETERLRIEKALEQNEARFHGIFDNVQDGILLVDLQSGFVDSANPAFGRMSAYRLEQLTGMCVSDLHPQSEHQRVAEAFAGLPSSKNALVENIVILRSDGSTFNADIHASLIELEGRHYVCGVIRDITERQQVAQELERHRDHLEELVKERTAELSRALEAAQVADQTKDAFLANMSHELRTPLNAVIGFAQLAHAASKDARQRDYLSKINGAAKSLSEIINDLLDLSKIAAGHMEFESAPFALHHLVERCKSMVIALAAGKGLEFSSRIDGRVPDDLIGDPHRLEQLLLNLLSNAIKYTPMGRVDLRIGLIAPVDTSNFDATSIESSPIESTTIQSSPRRKPGSSALAFLDSGLRRNDESEVLAAELRRNDESTVPDGQRVGLLIEVEDTGIGIGQEDIERLFKPFSQVDASMTRKYGGTGLGLAICKRLAEMMGGNITVSSRQGEGSIFRVEVWLGIGQPTERRNAKEGALPRSVRYENTRVLVVEDQLLNQQIVEELLQAVGIEVLMAKNGLEALSVLEKLNANTFDLILMDVQMPVMDGLTAARQIRALKAYENLPIVALTAHTMEHEKEAGKAAGMSDHISKPFEVEEFYRVLAKWIPLIKQRQVCAELSPPANIGGLPVVDGLDTQTGLAFFAGNEERYLSWLQSFVTEGTRDTELIRQGMANGNVKFADQMAHTLKGRLGMLGMPKLHALATELNAALRKGETPTPLSDRLHEEIVAMCANLRAVIGSAPPAKDVGTEPALPPDATPEFLLPILKLLEICDGASAEAITACLSEHQGDAWAPRLRQALNFARRFDFAAARRVLLS